MEQIETLYIASLKRTALFNLFASGKKKINIVMIIVHYRTD